VSRCAGARLEDTIRAAHHAANPSDVAWISGISAEPAACSVAAWTEDVKEASLTSTEDVKEAMPLRRESSSLPSPTHIFCNNLAGHLQFSNTVASSGGVHASNLPLRQATMRRESSDLAVPTTFFGSLANGAPL